jgi:GNAT superfamily N-acetyltransferase
MNDASPVVALGPSEQAIARRLMDALDRFNADTTGIVDARELLVTELGEDDELLGGLHGWSWGGTCWIESLWVREDRRGSGLGGRLMGAVERLARDRGCLQLALETHSFQAPGFYRRHGFEVVGTLPDYPRGHDHLIMRKPLADAGLPARGCIEIRMHHGPRAGLRPLFELADDSPAQLDAYLDAGRVLLAVDDGRTVGHLQLLEDAGTLEVNNMAVLESHERRGIGRTLMRAAIELARDEGYAVLAVATATADIGNLRFYQRLGFRMLQIERDAFTPATGYQPQDVDGIPLRDRVWLEFDLRATDRPGS